MKKGLLSRLANPLIVAGMALTLAVLAGLQYRWIGELSEAEKARLERSLELSARSFRGRFNRSLIELASGLTPGLSELARETYLDAAAARLASPSTQRGLRVNRAWMRRFDSEASPGILRFDAVAGSWEPVEVTDPDLPAPLTQPLRGFSRRGFGGGRPSSWTFLGEGPFLVHPLMLLRREDGRLRPDLLGILYVEPDVEAMRQALFPELFAEAFGELDELRYQAVIVEEGRSPRLIYASDEAARIEDFERSEVRLPLLWNREEPDARGGDPRGRGRGPLERWRGGPRGPGPGAGEVPPPPGRPGERPPEPPRERGDEGSWRQDFQPGAVSPGPGPEWVFMVRHRAGSLDAFVNRLRRRNLIISGGILALLIAGMVAVLISTRRAQRLAEMQMDFVAGVSHELRTPLAVIRSAGDNLAEGVVAQQEQVQEYGRLIRSEGRRLTGMVEQTLQFAAVQAGKRQYRIQSVAARELVEQAVEESRPTAEEAGFSIEVDLPEGLPMVSVDPSAASHSLQNLIGNAVKYGGEARWVGVSARRAGDNVAVAVRDKGPGIDPQELQRIFEPFFRGRRATEQQIKGSGLGLALARSDAEGFGGKLSVESRPGEGSVFTLILPGAKDDESS